MKIFLTLLVALGSLMTEKKECKSHGEGSDMLQIAIIEDEADLAQQTKVNAVRYLNEQGLEGNIAVFNDGMDIADNYKPIWDIIKHSEAVVGRAVNICEQGIQLRTGRSLLDVLG